MWSDKVSFEEKVRNALLMSRWSDMINQSMLQRKSKKCMFNGQIIRYYQCFEENAKSAF